MSARSVNRATGSLNLAALNDAVARHGLFHEDDRTATIAAVERAIESGRPSAAGTQQLVALGGGSGILAVLQPASSLDIFVSEWQSSIDDGGSTNVILDNFIRRGLGRGYSIGDLVSSLFKGFAGQSMLHGILDDQGRIMLAKQEDVEKGVIPETGTDGESCQPGKIVVFGARYGLPDAGSGEKNTRDVYYADSLQQWAELSLARNGKMFELTNDDAYTRFANGLKNLLLRVQPYIDEGIIELPGASIRNLLLVAVLDYLGLIDRANPRYEEGSNELLAGSDDEIARFHYGLELLAELVGIRDRARVGISHREPATVFARFRDVVVTVDQGGEKLVFSVEPGSKRLPGKVHVHTAGVVANSDDLGAIVKWRDVTLSVELVADQNPMFRLRVGNDESEDVLSVCDREIGSYVDWNSRRYPMSQDGTGLLRFEDESESAYRYRPLSCASGAEVYIRPRVTFRQTHVTETVSYSPIVEDGIAELSGQERVINRKSGKTEGVGIYRVSQTQKLAENPEFLREIKSEATKTITIGPGSLFTSVMSYFRTRGVAEALRARRQRGDIPIKLILNPTIDNETFGYRVIDIIECIERVAGLAIGEMVSEISFTRLDIDKLEQHLGQFETDAKWFMRQIDGKPELVDEAGLEYVRLLEGIYENMAVANTELLDDDGSVIRIRDEVISHPTRRDYIEAKIEQLYGAARQVVEPEIRVSAAAASVAAKKSRGGLSPTLDEIREIENSRDVAVVEEFVAGIAFSQSRIPGQPVKPRVVLMDDRTRFVLEQDCGLVPHSRIIADALERAGRSSHMAGDANERQEPAWSQVFILQKNAVRREILNSGSPATADYFDQLTVRSMKQMLDRVELAG